MTSVALSVSGLTVRQSANGAAPLVRDVSFRLTPGRCLTLLGESGSGKSLIAQALFGLLPREFIADGALSVGDGPPIGLSDRAALRALWTQRLFLTPQEPSQALNPTMAAGEQLLEAFPDREQRRDRQAQIFDAIDLPIASAKRIPAALSGGMSQRLLVAIASVVPAPVIVADEPTKGVDSERVEQILQVLTRLLAVRKSLLVITHDVSVARRLGGEAALVRDGAIVERGEADEVLDRPQHTFARAYMAASPERWPAVPDRRNAPTDAKPAVVASDLRFAYPRASPLFDGLSVTATPGRILAVVGPSGVGKTTLGDVLLGRLRPQAGQVRWGALDPYACSDRDLRQARPARQKLFQDPASAFAPHRRIGQTIDDLRRIRPALSLSTRLPPLLDRLKLNPILLDRYPDEVSGGEAQRLALACLLLMDPAFIVADEPTSRLDPIIQAETIGLLRELVAESDLALVLISHDRALVRAVADSVIDLGALAPVVRG